MFIDKATKKKLTKDKLDEYETVEVYDRDIFNLYEKPNIFEKIKRFFHHPKKLLYAEKIPQTILHYSGKSGVSKGKQVIREYMRGKDGDTNKE